MDAVAVQGAYDSACAVFTEGFRFVESRLYATSENGTSRPFRLGKERDDWIRPIKHEKWIYVFRRMPGAPSRWVEEIRLAADGEMYATPMADARMEPGARPAGVHLGKTMRLPRRIRGSAFVHHFFASRVRLPLPVVETLEREIHGHTPAVSFEPDSLGGNLLRDGRDLLVPILNPLSVTGNLHACFIAAADDLTSYTTPVEGSPGASATRRRTKKHLLASMLQAVTRGDGGGNALHQLQRPDVLDHLVDQYGYQVAFRKRRMERLGGYLARWLEGAPMRWARDAYAATPERLHEWLWVYGVSMDRISQSEAGRNFLQRVVDDPAHFVHGYFLPTTRPTGNVQQTIRKASMAVLTGWAHLAPVWVRGGRNEENVRLSLEYVLEEPVTFKTKSVRYHHDGSLVVQVEFEQHEFTVLRGRTVSHHELIVPGGPPRVERVQLKGAIHSVAAAVELVNLAFALQAVADAFSGDSAGARVFAVTNLVGASLDAGTALGQVFEVGAKKLALMGALSGLIDMVVAMHDAASAVGVGDTGALVGSLVVAAGSFGGLVGMLLSVGGAASATPVGVIALAIVAVGYGIRAIFAKTDIEILFAHCTWGKAHGTGGGSAWSPVPLAMLETDYDAQIQALANLLCKFTVQAVPPRGATIALAWVPGRAELVLSYQEVWRTQADTRVFVQSVRFEGEAGLPVTEGPLSVMRLGGSIFVQPPSDQVTRRPPVHRRSTRAGEEDVMDGDLEYIRLTAQLRIDLGFGEMLVVPSAEPVLTNLVE